MFRACVAFAFQALLIFWTFVDGQYKRAREAKAREGGPGGTEKPGAPGGKGRKEPGQREPTGGGGGETEGGGTRAQSLGDYPAAVAVKMGAQWRRGPCSPLRGKGQGRGGRAKQTPGDTLALTGKGGTQWQRGSLSLSPWGDRGG